MQEVYYISGLGADKSIFQKLQIDIQNQKFIEWVVPELNESIKRYSQKLTQQIDSSKKVILIGVSFGGIIAMEVAKLINPHKVILISSATQFKEIPLLYRIAGKLKLHKLVPSSFLKLANPFTYFFFGVKKKEDKLLLKTILKNTDNTFLKWAIDKIVSWKNVHRVENISHLHGTKDRILPCPKNQHIIKIKNGGHLMVYQQALEISSIINKEINKMSV